jgi:hypothetical protein
MMDYRMLNPDDQMPTFQTNCSQIISLETLYIKEHSFAISHCVEVQVAREPRVEA